MLLVALAVYYPGMRTDSPLCVAAWVFFSSFFSFFFFRFSFFVFFSKVVGFSAEVPSFLGVLIVVARFVVLNNLISFHIVSSI